MSAFVTGTGPTFPFARDGRGDWTTGSGVEAIESAIRQILGVKGASANTQGELPWRTEFGSQLHRLRHSNNNAALEDIARVFVIEAIRRYERRINLTQATVQAFDVESFGKVGLRVEIFYTIRNQRNPTVDVRRMTVEI